LPVEAGYCYNFVIAALNLRDEAAKHGKGLCLLIRKLLSGNEAIALGAYHAGVKVATAYPGTPSTEILENLARFPGVNAEWSTNEKVALEVAMGAAYGGARALVSMKHVGLNVAADPFLGASVTGVNGGLVVISADDPGMHSSQNEQDNRYYAKFAKVPLLEPADSQEAYDLMSVAFSLSEEFDTPVLIRTTTRISHGKSVVQLPEERATPPGVRGFRRNPEKLVMVPSHARPRHRIMEERLTRLAAYAETFPHNQILPGDGRLGIVTSGVAFQYAREVFPQASFLKLTMSYPLPQELVRRFAQSVEVLVVVEELDPFLEEALRALGLRVIGKDYFPLVGELSSEVVEEGARRAGLLHTPLSEETRAPHLPARPPVLCPGCPHTACAFALRKLGFYRSPPDSALPRERKVQGHLRKSGLIVTSDIGCYTLAVYSPLLALDTCACMGASIGQALGLEKAGVANRVVAVIGDSTFVHTGIASLVDVVYNQGSTTVIILDNDTTAMTGHQGHPGTGVNARGERTSRVRLEELARGIGVRDVQVVDAFDLAQVESTIRGAVERDEPSVIIVRGDCPLNVRVSGEPLVVYEDKCDGCSTCLRLGCPAVMRVGDKARIDPILCIGAACDVCAQVCPQEGIGPREAVGAPS
jgi:indolepyruvate ferredoxin oxidoreductase alpha subunit